MKIKFYSPNRIEPWCYRNVYDVGIGGSETSAVEMSQGLAARGHAVYHYSELPDDVLPHEWNGVWWDDLANADLDSDGLWIVYRSPETGKNLVPTSERRYWLVCQDVFYPNWKSEDVAQFERIIGLCPRHIAELQHNDPANAERVCMSSNGVNVGRMLDVEADRIARNPRRIIFASSPDRGLKETLDIFERAREQIADLELHVYYGMDNIGKICGGDRTKYPWKRSWDQYNRANNMPGVTWHGRIGQQDLWREYLKAGIWLYPTWFSETSCISCMEAQCLGAIPVTNPIWATGYNVDHGVFIEGAPSDPLVKARYVDAVVRLAHSERASEQLRQEMVPAARKRFDWQNFITQWESWMEVAVSC